MELLGLPELGTTCTQGSNIKVPCHNQRKPEESGAATQILPFSSLWANTKAEEPSRQVENTIPLYPVVSVCQKVDIWAFFTMELGLWGQLVMQTRHIPYQKGGWAAGY